MTEKIETKQITKEMQQFVVIGLGRFGKTVALTLANLGKEVLAIDTDSQTVKQIEHQVSGAVVADSTKNDVLHSLGVQNFDCVINCIGDDLEASILTTLICKDLGVEY
ncbi:MAG: TrkA family potassium uptake protein, partial [Clostridia bacterium]|nr:TrkA family potassium uptake protein [Clostridia bacterium]